MDVEATTNVSTVRKRKFPKAKLIIALVFIIAIAVTSGVIIRKKLTAKPAVTQRTARVMKGDLNATVLGSGPLIASSRDEVKTKVAGSVTKLYFKEGDKVKAGDLLCELDSTDAETTFEQNTNNLIQNQKTLSDSVEDLSKLNVYAPFSGQVSNITVAQGDTVGKGGVIFTVTDTSKFKLTVPFNGTDIGKISVGQQAAIDLPALMETVNGKVTYVSNSSYSTNSGGQLFDVEIEVSNPGGLLGGMAASAEVNTSMDIVDSTNTGTLSYINKTTVKSDNGGTLAKLNVKENQYVTKGALLAQFENTDLQRTKEGNDLKVNTAQNQLQISEKQLSYYKIYSPIDGTIVSQAIVEGDSLKAGDTVCIVADASQMKFTIPVDELDIAKISVGQTTNVTVDAVPGTSTKPVQGQVSKVALEGKSSNGVTTYDVDVTIPNDISLKDNMNANAEIFVQSKKDTLYVPIEAVQKMGGRTFVMVKADAKTLEERKKSGNTNPFAGVAGNNRGSSQNAQGYGGNANSQSGQGNGQNSNRQNGQGSGQNAGSQGGSQQNANRQANGSNSSSNSSRSSSSSQSQYYANAMAKAVEVGINNDSYIEITSGLNQGDEVILPPVSLGSSSSNNTQRTGGMFGGGGAPGGMAGGGARQ